MTMAYTDPLIDAKCQGTFAAVHVRAEAVGPGMRGSDEHKQAHSREKREAQAGL
jgi:hypothetical protein